MADADVTDDVRVHGSDDLPSWAPELFDAASAAAEDLAGSLAIALRYGQRLPLPGSGRTALRWQLLAGVAARDLTVARVLEAHSDALAILAEAGRPAPDGSWGVFAAEGPGVRLDATPVVAGSSVDECMLRGTKPWCSLGGVLDYALVSAHVEDGRGLFAVDLRNPAVTADPPSTWAARGLRDVVSVPVHFDSAPARSVGPTDWYLTRPGFAWGGIGVAACWLGAAQALRTTLLTAAVRRAGDLVDMHLGAVDVALHAAEAVLAAAAVEVDAGAAEGDAGALLALRTRSVVAAAVEETLTRVAHALGPAPLAFDPEHARRVADLEIYVRQHHAERDLAALGASLARTPDSAGQR